MKKFLLILWPLFFSANSFANGYIGGNWGQNYYGSEVLSDRNVSTKGSTFGLLLGYKYQFMGTELFYQNLGSEGKIIHDGKDYLISEKATSLGAALRFHFDIIYIRLGLAKYNLNQSLNVTGADAKRSAEVIYKIQPSDSSHNGSVLGFGLYRKFWATTFLLDFSRYNVNGIGHYDSFSVGVLIPIPAKFLEFSSR